MEVPDRVRHSRLLFDSFRQVTGQVLWNRLWTLVDDDAAIDTILDEAPCVIASHGTQDDPILNYGNQMALELWETDRKTFTSMPSRLTAEEPERAERERLLREVSTRGFITDYSGVRISATGRRFRIHRATVWTVIDGQGHHHGQAVVFSGWERLGD